MSLVAMQLEKLPVISFKVIIIHSDDGMMLLMWHKNIYGCAIGKTTYLRDMRSMHIIIILKV